MRFLVSGGMGYVGSRLVERLDAEGHLVAIIAQSGVSYKPSKHEVFEYSGEIKPLLAFMNAWKPEMVIHMAADVTKDLTISSIDSLLSANVVFGAHLALAAEETNVRRMINISTYSISTDGKSYMPQTFYANEDILTYFHQNSRISICTLSFYDIYGPNQPHTRFLNSLIEAIKKGSVFEMTKGEQDICFLHVDDAVDAIVSCYKNEQLFSKDRNQRYSVFGNEVFKLKDIPNMIARSLGLGEAKVSWTKPYRKNEIMSFVPFSPLLPGWRAKRTLVDSIQQL
jgi:UDP-glucuronate 4-epimerase